MLSKASSGNDASFKGFHNLEEAYAWLFRSDIAPSDPDHPEFVGLYIPYNPNVIPDFGSNLQAPATPSRVQITQPSQSVSSPRLVQDSFHSPTIPSVSSNSRSSESPRTVPPPYEASESEPSYTQASSESRITPSTPSSRRARPSKRLNSSGRGQQSEGEEVGDVAPVFDLEIFTNLMANLNTSRGRALRRVAEEEEDKLPGKGKGRSVWDVPFLCTPPEGERVDTIERNITGYPTGFSSEPINAAFLRALEGRFNEVNTEYDLLSLFVRSTYDNATQDSIRSILEENPNFVQAMDRLTQAGMAVSDAFFLLALIRFITAVNEEL